MQIYLYQNDTAVGPYTEDQVRVLVKSGAVSQTENAWHEGLSEWQPLNTILLFAMSGPASPLRILVVDDEKSTAKAMSYILEQAGFAVDGVHDGQEALEILKTSPDYHVLITDHRMLKMSGLELVEELRKTQFHGKVVVFTGYMTQEVESAYRALGVTHFLNKPLGPEAASGAHHADRLTAPG